MKDYRNEPRWIAAKFESYCAGCDRRIKRGEEIYFDPFKRQVYCNGQCGTLAEKRIEK